MRTLLAPHEKPKKQDAAVQLQTFLHQVSCLTDDFYHPVDIHHAYGRNRARYFLTYCS